jgi:hypothetical protein
MKKAISVTQKRQGRPATGQNPHFTARLPQDMIDAIEAWAKKRDVSRSAAARQIIDLGLRAKVR